MRTPRLTEAEFEALIQGRKHLPEQPQKPAVNHPWAGKSHAGFRPDLNQFFRSAMEANLARFFKFTGQIYIYEPCEFHFPIEKGIRTYTPDFYLPREDRFVEVKGFLDRKSKTKLTHAFSRGASGLLAQRGCARRVMPRKESRQEGQRVGFIHSGIEFQLVAEDGVHRKSIPNRGEKNHPAPCKVSFTPGNGRTTAPQTGASRDLWKSSASSRAHSISWSGSRAGTAQVVIRWS